MEATATKRTRNWWKVAFFVMLFAFELAREWAVIEAHSGAVANASFNVFRNEGYVAASGRWERTDGDGKLEPVTVTVQCRQETGQCLEATTNMMDRSVFAPDVSFYPATFSADSVTYVNDDPACARYTARIDTKLEQVIAVRERKTNQGNCAMLEPRLSLRLAGGTDADAFSLDDHFVPIIKIIAAVLEGTS